MTRAPLFAAYMMPAATSDIEPLPLASRTRTDMMLQRGQMPATPVLLLVEAAAIPATWVPCPN